jgi:hypothetical protein
MICFLVPSESVHLFIFLPALGAVVEVDSLAVDGQ